MPIGPWLVITATILALAWIAHPMLPCYDVRVTGENGSALLIHDRTGRVQRVNYGADGEPVLKGVVTPF